MKAATRWLRVEALTPANLGSAAGEATLDRPTQKDAWLDLPFLPDSGLKGALAGRLGDVPATKGARNAAREEAFGSPDREEGFGRPAPFLLGNAEVLAFPLPLGEGGPAWIFPALAVARAAHRLGGVGRQAWTGLSAIEEGPVPRALAWGDARGLAGLAGLAKLRRERSATLELAAPELQSLLRRLAGPGGAEGAAWLLVPASVAGLLWREAAERRTSTALAARRKTVRPGSLRRVELIPQGTLFLSLATLLEPGKEPALDAPLQVGSGESVGWGWVRWSEVQEGASPDAGLPLARLGAPAPDPGDLLGEAYAAVGSLRGVRPELRKAVQSVVRGFGPRAAFSGFAAALAFHAAKAKPAKAPSGPGAELGAETLAHRWLLAALRSPRPAPPAPAAADEELLAWLRAEDAFAPERLAGFEEIAMARWEALRRAVELELDDPVGAAEGSAE